jgi:hypothetical protein
MKIKTLLCLLGVVALFAACKPEVDLTGDYKNITVVYGVLNPDDSVQYIKVYKGYLIDGDARVPSQNLDSISFYTKIQVLLEEYNANNQLVKTIELDTTTSVPINPGDFTNPVRVLYYTAEPIHLQSHYKLRIIHKETGKEIYAETPIVSGIKIKQPYLYINLNAASQSSFKIEENSSAKAYSVKLTFYYLEKDHQTLEVKQGKIVKNYTQRLLRSNSFSFVPKDIYKTIAANLASNPNVTRYMDGDNCLEFEVWGATEELARYIEVNTPSSSVAQNQRIYTNLVSDDNSAYGIFAARGCHFKRYSFSPSSGSEDTLVKGVTTGHLNFDYYHSFQGKNR